MAEHCGIGLGTYIDVEMDRRVGVDWRGGGVDGRILVYRERDGDWLLMVLIDTCEARLPRCRWNNLAKAPLKMVRLRNRLARLWSECSHIT